MEIPDSNIRAKAILNRVKLVLAAVSRTLNHTTSSLYRINKISYMSHQALCSKTLAGSERNRFPNWDLEQSAPSAILKEVFRPIGTRAQGIDQFLDYRQMSTRP